MNDDIDVYFVDESVDLSSIYQYGETIAYYAVKRHCMRLLQRLIDMNALGSVEMLLLRALW